MAWEKSGAAIESVGETQVASRSVIMPAFSPALITIMRSVLEDAMTRVPAEQATTVTKAYLAEFILKAAAGGLTSYEGLITAAVGPATDHCFHVHVMAVRAGRTLRGSRPPWPGL